MMSSYNPAAPPPSYDDLFNNNQSQNNDDSNVQRNTEVFVPLDLNTLHLRHPTTPIPPPQQPQPEPQITLLQVEPLILGPYPTRLQCPHCNKSTLTRIEYRSSYTTHAIALMLCLMGCFCLAPVPYCVDNCKNAAHYCRKCSHYIGTDINGGLFRNSSN